MKKVLISYGERPGQEIDYESTVKWCNSPQYCFETVNHRNGLSIDRAMSPYNLDKLYREKNSTLLKYYDYIYERCKLIDIFIVDHENIYHPEFIRKLGKITYTVLYTGDDPESSYICSLPYVHSFDHVLCYSVTYNAENTMEEQLKIWGAKRANYRPFGWQYAPEISGGQCFGDEVYDEAGLFEGERDIDLIYVGGQYTKTEQLLTLKKKFGPRFILHGNWGGIKSWFWRLKKYNSVTIVTKLSKNQLFPMYRRAKIGINMHMSFGPSNLRLWQLPINGVMQITDNPVGTSKLFDIGQEIICYENGNIDEAIGKIEFFLKKENEGLRIEIAKKGYLAAREKYSFSQGLHNALMHIEIGVKEKNAR